MSDRPPRKDRATRNEDAERSWVDEESYGTMPERMNDEGVAVTKAPDLRPERHWVPPSSPQIDKNVDLYRIAYDEGKRAVDDQSVELAAARTRAVQFLAFVGSATAFLASRAVDVESRTSNFYLLAGAATGVAALSIILVALTLLPKLTRWEIRVSPRELLEQWIETDVPVPSEGKVYRELALHYDAFQVENESKLVWVRRLYIASIVAGATQVTAWATIVWIYG